MFDVKNCVKSRYFDLKLYDDAGRGKAIYVEPPKVKTLKNIISFSGKKDITADEFRFMLCSILEKNKEHIKVEKYVGELTVDQLNAVFTAFMEWINNAKTEKN